MSRKLEINTRMQTLQKEFSELNAEKKEIEDIERRAIRSERYKDFLFKVGVNGYSLEDAEKIGDVTDEDRETAELGNSGVLHTPPVRGSEFYYVLMKDKSEHTRLKTLLLRLNAAERILSKDEKDKKKHISVLLGEVNE
jgi:hypothetical protein